MTRYTVLEESPNTVTVLDREDEWEFVFACTPQTRELLFLRTSQPHRAVAGVSSTMQRRPSMTVYLILEDHGYEVQRFYD